MRIFVEPLIKYIFFQAVEGFNDEAVREGEVHADTVFAVEGAAVLPDDADFDAGGFEGIDGGMVAFAPVAAVDKEHIGALWLGDADAVKVGTDVVHGIVNVVAQHLAQLVHPDVPFFAISADESVHGENVHVVVVWILAFAAHTVA